MICVHYLTENASLNRRVIGSIMNVKTDFCRVTISALAAIPGLNSTSCPRTFKECLLNLILVGKTKPNSLSIMAFSTVEHQVEEVFTKKSIPENRLIT